MSDPFDKEEGEGVELLQVEMVRCVIMCVSNVCVQDGEKVEEKKGEEIVSKEEDVKTI